MNLSVMRKLFIILLIALILGIGVVSAGDNVSHTYVPNNMSVSDDDVVIVYADSDGHFNIPFSDGSKGYCLEYMEEEAVKGDAFFLTDTSFAVNGTGDDVSNLLKVYFIEYDGYKDDPVVAQHMIWHFTDNFDGWRINKTLVNNIKETSQYKTMLDTDVIKYNSTHNLGYRFNSAVSPYEHHQNFWLYNIWFELIKPITDENVTNGNVTCDNITDGNVNNTMDYSNFTKEYFDIMNVPIAPPISYSLDKYVTANPLTLIVLSVLMCSGMLLIKRK